MDIEWDLVAPAIPSGNLLPVHLYRALTEFADRCPRTETLRTNTYAHELIAVEVEVEHIRSWIEVRSGSLNTARTYYSEARRLLMWAVAIAVKPLRYLSREDLYSYRTFLLEPNPAWIGPKTPSLFPDGKVNPRWRPFEKALTPKHVLHIHRILKSLFDYLADCGYRENNPLHAARGAKVASAHHKERAANPTIPPALNIDQWHAVLEAIEALPRGNRDQLNYYERSRFLLRLFYHLGARTGEIAMHTMSDFRQRDDGCWYWQVRKGSSVEHIDVNDDMLNALIRYRQHIGIELLPTSDDRSPLLLNRAGQKAISGRQILRNVKEVFLLAAEILLKRDPLLAAQLRRASPRWIRNTMALHSVQLCEQSIEELAGVQLHLRHSRLENTLGFVRNAEKARRAAADRLSAITKQASET